MLGFQLFQHEESSKMLGEFPSAISRYLVSNRPTRGHPIHCQPHVSIRYIAVLGFQHWIKLLATLVMMFQSAISRYLDSNYLKALGYRTSIVYVSIRYIAVLGFQQFVNCTPHAVNIQFQSAISRYLDSNEEIDKEVREENRSFNPLYRGTWIPTLPEKHPL